MKQKGQTLIEALIALGAAVVIISAITITVLSSLNSAQFTKNQNLATQYANEGIEFLRQISQSDWVGFLNYNSVYYCLGKITTGGSPASFITIATNGNATGCGGGPNVDNFVRQLEIDQNSSSCSNQTKATVTVFWADGNCTSSSNLYCHNVKLVSCYSNLYAVPTP